MLVFKFTYVLFILCVHRNITLLFKSHTYNIENKSVRQIFSFEILTIFTNPNNS